MKFECMDIKKGSILGEVKTLAEIPTGSYFTRVCPRSIPGNWGRVMDGSYIGERLVKLSELTFKGTTTWDNFIQGVEARRNHDSGFWMDRSWVTVTPDFKAESLFNKFITSGIHESGHWFH